MSVNLDELDYLDQKILTNDNSGNVFIRNLSNSNALNRRFGFSVDSHGVVHLEDNKSKDDLDKEEDIFHAYEKKHSTALSAAKTMNELDIKNLILYHTEESHGDDRKKLYLEIGRAHV